MQSDRHCTAVHAARRRRDQSVVAATSHIPFSRHYTTWALQAEPHKSHLGQRRPSGKSREAGRPGNAEDRQPMQAALADNDTHERSIGGGSTTRTVWENKQRLHIRTSPLPPSKDTSTNNPYHSTHFPVQSMLYNLKILMYP